MTPTQALQILTQATAQLTASRQVHLQLIEAIQILEKHLAGGAVQENVKNPLPAQDAASK